MLVHYSSDQCAALLIATGFEPAKILIAVGSVCRACSEWFAPDASGGLELLADYESKVHSSGANAFVPKQVLGNCVGVHN